MIKIIWRILYGIKQQIIESLFRMWGDYGKIYMFHQVTNNIEKWEDSNFAITTDSFMQLCEGVLDNSNICSIEMLPKCVAKEKAYYITFDDAYDCVFLEAYPILKKLNIPFSVFVTCNFLDRKGYLSKDMLIQLDQEPLCTIGAHGLNHRLSRFISREETIEEIKKSKEELEIILGHNIELFAFPYGSVFACSKRDIEIVKNSGYKLAFSTLNAPLNRVSIRNTFFIPRVNINQNNFMKRVLKNAV